MKKNIVICTKKIAYFSILLFIILKCIGMQYSSSIALSISVSLFVFMIYSRYLWIYNPFLQMPRIYGKYKGKIHYKFGGGGVKETEIEISQTLFHSSIKLITDEMTSYSKTSEIILEDSSYVLYYSYIKKPKSAFEKKNPIQYGTCRIVLRDEENLILCNQKNPLTSVKSLFKNLRNFILKRIQPSQEKLHGTYWTSFETSGDIYFKRIEY